ncbi:MAG: FAD:protein FMN transferase, partial [Gammaproteobacteria bacterium]|nr:FAD:protein FMN transferase [Gammaproteobacteria bacterium]
MVGLVDGAVFRHESSLAGWMTGWVRHFVTLIFWRRMTTWVLALGALGACGPPPAYHHYRGEAMGTQVALTYAGCAGDVAAAVAHELQQVDAQLSTWRPDSEAARFNASAAGDWFPVSAPVAALAIEALALSRRSGGAFDLTVAPLVQLWGFGSEAPANGSAPSSEAVAAAMRRVGWRNLEARPDPPALRKRLAGLSLDFSAIGKGHGVDRVAERLEGLGCHSYLVDIGGEVRTLGLGPKGGSWRIGVEQPDGGAPRWVLRLSGQSAATSGDYRNFRMLDGRRLSHAIDPRAGQPVSHALASVTVVAARAAQADGLATAIQVLGPNAGWRFAQDERAAALLLVRGESGFEHRYTESMSQF